MKPSCLLLLLALLLVQATMSTYSQNLCTTKLTSKKPSAVSTKSAAVTVALRPTITSSITSTKIVAHRRESTAPNHHPLPLTSSQHHSYPTYDYYDHYDHYPDDNNAGTDDFPVPF